MNPFELTLELMQIPSVTGAEGEVGKYLCAILEEQGLTVETQEVTPDRFNLVATAGSPEVILCTHIDTVPPVLGVSEDEDALYGRGACDTKGIIAAMLAAGKRLRADGEDRFGYLFLVGEETGGDGAKAANQLEWNSKYVIVGEPTGNQLARAQKGTLMADLKVKGKAAHSGYPEAGRSAVHPLVEVLYDCGRADWGSDPVLGRATCNIGVLRAGEKANILASEATASLMLRTVEEPEEARRRLHAVVAGRAEIEILAAAAPQFMHVLDGFPDTVVSFGSDVPYLGNLGKPLLIGPGSILDAHTAHEKILKQDLLDGIDIYERLVRMLLAEDAGSA
jgi:acetylornithine deacetylase